MNEENIKYQRAKEKVKALKAFYLDLVLFVLVNLFLFLLNITFTPDNLWFVWPLVGYGIGIIAHAIFVFGFSRPYGLGWEEKKIKEIMGKG